ncbi:MAG TPA: hypothetical protein PL045_06385 [Chitinophagaceae bacterium]|nr:hypothetical protein [Chitinophagaceae bacterium]
MLKITISGNPNGKLLSDCFIDFRMDGELFFTGADVEVYSNKHFLGYAKVVGSKRIYFSEISTSDAYLCIGNDAAYLKTVFQRIHGPLTADRVIYKVLFQYSQRHLPEQQGLFKRYWDLAQEKHTVAYRDTEQQAQSQFTLNL